MKHILMVDDNLTSLKQAAALIHDIYKVSMVKSGEQALAFLAKIKPDLILLDVEMPEMDGYETISRIRANAEWKNIPVIFLTGNADTNTEIRCFESGAVDYITKPFSKEVLLHRVGSHLDLYEYRLNLESVVKQRTEELVALNAKQERLNAELSMAVSIQSSMLPKELPGRAEFDLNAFIQPAVEVGGDFYDYRMLDDDHLFFAVGDVVGKGMPAALLMVKCMTLIAAASKEHMAPGEIMTVVNDLLTVNNDEDYFITCLMGVLEVSTGELSISNAGHTPPALVNGSGQTSLLEIDRNFVLGIMDGYDFSENKFSLSAGDAVVVYTDGVDEAENAEHLQYGADRLLEIMSKYADESISAKEITSAIRKDVSDFAAGALQSDDITLVTLKCRKGAN